MSFDTTHPEILDAVRRALDEDIGAGDITSGACIAAGQMAEGRFLARQSLVVAGIELLAAIYQMRGGIEELRLLKQSGDAAEEGEAIALVRGRARTLLECERVALNFLQRLSGIATLTARYVAAVSGTTAKILDTRKTTPGLRRLEKMAVLAGGGVNHRLGLWDAILVKNNHIAAAGGVKEALAKALAVGVPVEIEVRTRREIDEALASGAGHLLLDNLTPAQAAEEIRHISGRARVEISGGIALENVRAYAEAGPDFISVGALTHSAPAVNLNFRLELK